MGGLMMILLPAKSSLKLLVVAGRAAELPGSRLLVGGDWNLEPDEFPLDLVQGFGLQRPLARPGATAPQGH
eukprot:368870-Amphidinium_carterae.1